MDFCIVTPGQEDLRSGLTSSESAKDPAQRLDVVPETQLNNTQTKYCVACANEIPALALKCTYCQSFQDWRRYVDVGHTSLALLIALASVLTVFSAKISNLYKFIFVDTSKPSVIVSILDISPQSATILYRNTGLSQVFIDSSLLCRIPITNVSMKIKDHLAFRYPRPHEIDAVYAFFFRNENGAGQFLEADSSVTLNYPFIEKIRERGRPFNEEALSVRSYCFFSGIGFDGRKFGDFILLDEHESVIMQPRPPKDEPPMNSSTMR